MSLPPTLTIFRLFGLAFRILQIRPQRARSETLDRAVAQAQDEYRAALGRWAERLGLGQDDVAAWRGERDGMNVTVAAGRFAVELLVDGDVDQDAFDHPALVRAIRSIELVEGELCLRFAPDVHPDVLAIAIRAAHDARPPASPPEPRTPYR